MPAQAHPMAIVNPLTVGVAAVICTIAMHALAVGATVHFVRRERRLGRAAVSFWSDMAIVGVTMLFAFAAHLVEITFWAALFMMCGEFAEFGAAYEHSAVNYTTLGYGDVVMTSSWRLLGPIEAADGMLMFGVSTAMIFAVIQLLVRVRFVDLRE